MNLLWLVFAHFIADWGLQSEWMGREKTKHWIVRFAHCMIYTGVIALTLKWLGIFELWKIVFIFVGHYAMDWGKGKIAKSEKDWWLIYPDHIWHFIQLIIVCFVP